MFNVLLVIWVNPFCILVSSLGVLNTVVLLHYFSCSTLELSISNNLLATHWFLLHSIQFVLIDTLLLHHGLFFDLLWSLKVNLVSLSLIEAFEMIWLNSMWCQHAHLGLWVLCHEIVIISKMDFSLVLISPNLMLIEFSLFLFSGHNPINLLSIFCIFPTFFIMFTLGLAQYIVIVQCLFIKEGVNIFLSLFFNFFFPDLLFAPILLL